MRRRVVFDLRARIRDHHRCCLYERCLDAAARINAPRVCWEGCPIFRPPPPGNARTIAELLDHIQDLMPVARHEPFDGSESDEEEVDLGD